MAIYFAQDGSYGDASGLLVVDEADLSPELTSKLDRIENDDERYAFILRVLTGEER